VPSSSSGSILRQQRQQTLSRRASEAAAQDARWADLEAAKRAADAIYAEGLEAFIALPPDAPPDCRAPLASFLATNQKLEELWKQQIASRELDLDLREETRAAQDRYHAARVALAAAEATTWRGRAARAVRQKLRQGHTRPRERHCTRHRARARSSACSDDPGGDPEPGLAPGGHTDAQPRGRRSS